MTAEELAVGFARVLRGLGVSVPIGSVINFGEAVGLLGIDQRDHVYWAGRSTLIHRPEDLGVYDRAFAVYWERRGGGSGSEQVEEPLLITLAVDDGSDDGNDDPDDAGERN
ncbi:MAG: hypothetical protein RLZZ362_752, partial [Actinomycetota bacterium]